MRGLRALSIVAGLLTAFGSSPTFAQARPGMQPGDFDYYVLTLSWSPTYCETDGGRSPQCRSGRPYAFVLHGLWPQLKQGWPENCRTRERPWVPEELIRSMLDIMPARELVIHQYRKHGTCSGLDPKVYFANARRLFESVRIPARYLSPTQPILISPHEIETDFVNTNQQLSADQVAVACGGGRRLREVRICFSKALQPVACGHNEEQRRLCSLDRVVLPPIR